MRKLTADERIKYAQAAWGNFQDKAKTERDMTNSEYYLVAKWMDAGIPLWCVLRGINDFDGKPKRLEAVVASVERVYEYGLQAVGPL